MDCFSIQSPVLFCSARPPLVGSVRQDHPPLDPMSEPYRSAEAVIRNWTPGRQLTLASKQGNADPDQFYGFLSFRDGLYYVTA